MSGADDGKMGHPRGVVRIILLHGLARGPRSMAMLGLYLRRRGHEAVLVGYPSTRATVADSARYVLRTLAHRGLRVDAETSFVGHSMGGVVYRAMRTVQPSLVTGRSVTLGSPLGGSLAARTLARFAVARARFGPALADLGRIPNEDERVFPGPTLAIAGTLATPLVPAYTVLRSVGHHLPSDSTVRVEEALCPFADARLTVRAAHTLLPYHPDVWRNVDAFVRGR